MHELPTRQDNGLAVTGGTAVSMKTGESATTRRACQWACQFLSVWLANPKAAPAKWANGVPPHWANRLEAEGRLSAGARRVFEADNPII